MNACFQHPSLRRLVIARSRVSMGLLRQLLKMPTLRSLVIDNDQLKVDQISKLLATVPEGADKLTLRYYRNLRKELAVAPLKRSMV
ncbi:MAG: hypothetical protein R3C05_22215 [Pirellulaceae bacterium]